MEFYGFEVDQNGHRQTDRNLGPIKKLVPPTNPSEARTLMGLFNTARDRINDFGIVTDPLTKLTSNKVKFEWTDECQHAFDLIRSAMLGKNTLVAPDARHPQLN